MSLTLPVEGVPGVHDLLTGARIGATGYPRDQATGRVQASAPLTGRPMLVDFNEGAADVIADRSGVSAERQLSIGEIIARHQQQQRAQDALVQNYIAHARMQQHFRPTVTDPGYDVVTENRYFVAGDDVEWEELSFSVNGSKWGADRPPFPLLQPEKVLSLPLQLRFDEGYRYRLAGTERVDGFDCYVVRFEPLRQDGALYRGTVWIDRKTFARVRVQAVQGGLAAPVVSNEETQHYSPVTIGNRPVFLFSGLTARQIVLIAGRNLLVEKSVAFTDFRVNDPDFDRERASARESDRVMYRETDRGLRYYVKEDGTRVVSDRADEAREGDGDGRDARSVVRVSAADPRDRLPELPVRLAQHAAGDPVCRRAGGGQHPAAEARVDAVRRERRLLRHRRAVERSRLRGGGSARGERVLTWPLSTGLNLGWQATPFQKATLQYQFRFDGYVHDTTTAENFDVPSSTVTQRHRRRLGVPARRIQPAVERHVVRPRDLEALGLPATGGAGGDDDIAADLREIRRRPVARFLLQHVPEDSSERRVVRRPRSRSLREISVRAVRRHADSRRAGVRRAASASWRWRAGRIRSTSSSSTGSISFSTRRGAATIRAAAPGSRSPASASPSTSARPGTRFCASISARACCRRATVRSARRRCRSCC